ncbi:MAG: hypothetical protein M1812_004247 [Candelaria pacifica]|nr:MAG: hypothetical protein M1812_004247 [Candelaria pacifica]
MSTQVVKVFLTDQTSSSQVLEEIVIRPCHPDGQTSNMMISNMAHSSFPASSPIGILKGVVAESAKVLLWRFEFLEMAQTVGNPVIKRRKGEEAVHEAEGATEDAMGMQFAIGNYAIAVIFEV